MNTIKATSQEHLLQVVISEQKKDCAFLNNLRPKSLSAVVHNDKVYPVLQFENSNVIYCPFKEVIQA